MLKIAVAGYDFRDLFLPKAEVQAVCILESQSAPNITKWHKQFVGYPVSKVNECRAPSMGKLSIFPVTSNYGLKSLSPL